MTTRTRNLLLLLLIIPPLLACFGPIPSIPPDRVNQMDEVLGEVQVIVGAERDPRGGKLSANGRWLVVFISDRGRAVLLDLLNKTERPVKAGCGVVHVRWLDDHRFVVGSFPECYALVDARDLSFVRLRPLRTDKEPDGLRQAETIMRQAQELYLLKDSFVMSAHTVIALGGVQDALILRLWDDEVQALLARIPHVTIPALARHSGDPLYSPDGRFYALEHGDPVEIRAADGTLLAMAHKRGWSARVLGWTHDGNGVYFRLQIGGADAAVLNPEAPVFKLSMPSN